MQMGFYFNQELCTHCCACVVACKDWHDVPAGPASYIRISVLEKGKYPEVSMCAMFGTCYHCAEPACVPACPPEAITKREEDGIVVVNREECIGEDDCGICEEECPYDAPQFGAEENAKMQKCDFCIDRLAENKNPICVEGCNTYALEFGPVEELRAKYGDIRHTEGFMYSDKLIPSIVFKPVKEKKDLAIQKTVVLPPTS
ncbi:4Fe-4S dicluster domain-containing protein [Thermodesulfobacteriota bacterium]